MLDNNKKLSPAFLNQYLRDILKVEYNLKFDERTMNKILEGLEYGIDKLVEDCYSFKFLGFKFEVYHKKPKIYKDVRTGKIETSKPHYSLRIKVPRAYQRKLKDKTRYNSNEKPTPMGLSMDDIERLNI